MYNFVVIVGDITQSPTPVDAIVTLINPQKIWSGGVDNAIYQVAGTKYHEQAAKIPDLKDKQVIVATGARVNHHGNFHHVIFVVDDLVSPLNELVFAALEAAYYYGFTSVLLPMMRTGVMLGVFEPDVQTVVKQMSQGVERFVAAHPSTETDMMIGVVVYDDMIGQSLMAHEFRQLDSGVVRTLPPESE